MLALPEGLKHWIGALSVLPWGDGLLHPQNELPGFGQQLLEHLVQFRGNLDIPAS